MNFSRSEMQTMMLDGAERLLLASANPNYWRAQRDSPLGFEEARWAAFAELGWLALAAPEDCGGLAGSLEDIALLNITLGKALAIEPYASTAIIAMHILDGATDRECSKELVEEIISGTLRVALADQEPGAAAFAVRNSHNAPDAALGTIAKRTANGFSVSGTKLLALDAGSAHKMIVTADIDDSDGVGLFLVDCDAPGVTRDIYPLIDGTRAADITLTNVALPGSALLAGGNAGRALLEQAIGRASIALMAQAVGAMEACLRLCGDYVKQRKQFGQAIGSFQAIQHIMADMFVAAHQARSMLYHAIANAGGTSNHCQAALSAARIVIGDAGQLVSRSGIQVHGGYGLTDEYAISHYFRRLLAIEKQYGDLETHVTRYAELLLI